MTPEQLNEWRIVPRFSLLWFFGISTYLCMWFTGLAEPSTQQVTFVSTVFASGPAWIGLYQRRAGQNPKESD